MNTENKCFIPGDIVICKIDNELRFGLVISKNSKHNKYVVLPFFKRLVSYDDYMFPYNKIDDNEKRFIKMDPYLIDKNDIFCFVKEIDFDDGIDISKKMHYIGNIFKKFFNSTSFYHNYNPNYRLDINDIVEKNHKLFYIVYKDLEYLYLLDISKFPFDTLDNCYKFPGKDIYISYDNITRVNINDNSYKFRYSCGKMAKRVIDNNVNNKLIKKRSLEND